MTTISSGYERARLRKVAGECVGNTVLDLGYAQYPNPYLTDMHRVGVDLNSPSTTDITYEEQLIGDVTALEPILGNRKFDTIIAGELIEHVRSPYEFLESLKRYLADDGRLIITTPNPLGFPVFLFELFDIRSRFYTEDHLYYFLPRWMRRIIEFSGYELLAIKPVGLWLPRGHIPIWPTILSYQLVYVCKVRPEN